MVTPCRVPTTRNATKSEKKKLEHQTAVVFISIIAIIAVLVIVAFISVRDDRETRFEYRGINFDKTYFDQMLLYTASYRVHYNINNTPITNNATFYFIKDPRKLDYTWEKILRTVGIKTERQKQAENISFIQENKAYLSIVQPIRQCEDNYPAVFELSSFLALLAMDVKGAVSSPEYSMNSSVPVITCENSTNNTVIMLSAGNSNSWTRKSDNCYEVTFKSCQIMKATERFQLDILDKYAKTKEL